MPTIAHTVHDLVKNKPFLHDAILRGIINYAALAEEIHADIEKTMGKKVQQAAIVMALRRLTEKETKLPLAQLRFTQDSSIVVRDGLVQITVEKNTQTRELLKKLFLESQFSVTQGVFEITIIAHRKEKKRIEDIFENITRCDENLSALTINIPDEFVDIPGFFYMMTRALAWENINLEELVSTPQEFTILVKSQDAPRAFMVLKKVTES